MKRDSKLWNLYVRQYQKALDKAQATPGHDRDKWKWAGWDCWSDGYRAGQRSTRAKQAAKKRR